LVSLLWTQRQDIGPSARFGHALAYDQARNRTLLVGGDGLGARSPSTPNTLASGETFTLTVGLDQPALEPTNVGIAVDGMDVGFLIIDAGATTATSPPVLVDDLGLPPGTYTFTATLGAVTLTALLTFT
jgi:hypothetical protein